MGGADGLAPRGRSLNAGESRALSHNSSTTPSLAVATISCPVVCSRYLHFTLEETETSGGIAQIGKAS